jgi:hypothetical protein
MTLPSDLPTALAMLGSLLRDPNLVTGLWTVALILVASGALTALILSAWTKRTDGR